MNKIEFGNEKIKEGVEELSRAVGSTLGPKGRTVLIRRQTADGNYAPYPTKDGVTVSKFVKFKDQIKDMAAKIVSQSARSTVASAGDGTTSSVVLTNGLVQRGYDAEASGRNMVDIVNGIQTTAVKALKILDSQKQEMTEDKVKHISYISTNNDDHLSDIITEAFMATGPEGFVDVKSLSFINEVELDIKKGTILQAGFSHRQFITNVNEQVAEFDRAKILVSNSTISEFDQLLHVLKYYSVTETNPNPPAVVLIGDFEKNFAEAFVSNVAKGKLKGALINPGAFVDTEMLKDFATLVGAKYFDNAAGNNFDYVDESFFGEAEAKIGFGFSIFSIDNPGDVSERVEYLKGKLEEEPDSVQFKDRLKLLSGSHSTINVGAPTEGAAKEIKDRVDDAVAAVRAAFKLGFLPGGGVALKDLSKSLSEEDEVIFREALLDPMKKILSNAGLEYKDLPVGIGIDASRGAEVDVVEVGIIDPALVSLQVIANATSAASTLLLTNAMIIQDES